MMLEGGGEDMGGICCLDTQSGYVWFPCLLGCPWIKSGFFYSYNICWVCFFRLDGSNGS